jgi:hypothetical protein
MNGLADALVRATAADVAAHGVIDVGVGGIGFFGEQRDGGHNLSGLSVAALRYVFLHPRLLDGVTSIHGQTLDRRDLLPRHA